MTRTHLSCEWLRCNSSIWKSFDANIVQIDMQSIWPWKPSSDTGSQGYTNCHSREIIYEIPAFGKMSRKAHRNAIFTVSVLPLPNVSGQIVCEVRTAPSFGVRQKVSVFSSCSTLKAVEWEADAGHWKRIFFSLRPVYVSAQSSLNVANVKSTTLVHCSVTSPASCVAGLGKTMVMQKILTQFSKSVKR